MPVEPNPAVNCRLCQSSSKSPLASNSMLSASLDNASGSWLSSEKSLSTRSNNGFSNKACSTASSNSKPDICNSLIACCSWGFNCSCCVCLSLSWFCMFQYQSIIEIFAQIHFTDTLILHQLFRQTCCQYTALGNDVSTVTNAQGFAHIVIGNQNTNASLF